MKILSLATRNFRNLADREWKFDARFQVVKGPNEAGKSSLLEAVLAALYGDATSTDKRYGSYRRWNSAEHIYVALDLALKVGQLKLERDFENRKNRYTFGDKTVQAKDKVRNFLAEHLPIAVEESFRQTACVRQDEVKSDIEPSQLKSQLESRSLSSTGHDLANLQKELDSHNSDLRRGLVTIAPKNPGPIKVLEDDVQRLRDELAQREGSEREAGAAVTDFEVADAQIEKMTRDLSQGEERQDLDKKYVEAETLYKQKESEIGELTDKKERLKQLPQLVGSAEAEVQRLEELFQEQKARREQTRTWKQKIDALGKAQHEATRLAKDIQDLENLNERLRTIINPLTTLDLTPEDFARFHTLEQKLEEGQKDLDQVREEERRLAEGIEENKNRVGLLDQKKATVELLIAMLESERDLAEQARQAKTKQQQLSVEYSRVSQKAAQLATLVSQQFALAQKLEAYKTLSDIDPTVLHKAITSASQLEKVIEGEGVGFQVEPEHAVRMTVQLDNGPEREVVIDTLQKYTARREITVRLPGVGLLRLTNESPTAQQLQQRQREIADVLSRASADGVDDLLRQFDQRDHLATDLRNKDVSLEAALESRSKESWDQESAELAEQLTTVSTQLEKLTSVREFPIVERDLSDHRQKLNLLAQDRTQAETRLQMFTKRLIETQNAARDRQDKLRKMQEDITTLIQRSRRESEAGLKALEGEYIDYAKSAAEIQEAKAGVLNGMREADVYARHEAEKETIEKLTEQLDLLKPFALSDIGIIQLEKEITDLEGKLRKKRDELSRFQREKEILVSERPDEKYNQAVTQAAIADQNRKTYLRYAFANGGERIDFGREMKALKDELEKLRNTRAELKVKSDSAGLNQERISELKEAIAEHERRIARLKHRLEVDSTVLQYLQEARNKALADLLAAIPAGVGNLLDRITAGRYQRVDGNGFDLRVWSAEKGDNLEQDEMSGGSLDQFYLVLRLEAIRSIFAEDLPPLILDDPLVSCDPIRRSRIIEILDEHANSGQVIYLTCHDWPELDRFACLQLP